LDFFGSQGWWPADSPFEVIVGTILTQNTAWRNVERAIDGLKQRGLMIVPSLLSVSDTELASIIRPSGYFNVKTRRLKAVGSFLMDEYQGDLTRVAAEPMEVARGKFLRVRGIGPETADSILLYAFNRPTFVVDAYTRRILSRHHVIEDGATYDAIRTMFMQKVPGDVPVYKEYHALLVRLGKTFCKVAPRCVGCPLDE
jgi:endonuclease-3 related protein